MSSVVPLHIKIPRLRGPLKPSDVVSGARAAAAVSTVTLVFKLQLEQRTIFLSSQTCPCSTVFFHRARTAAKKSYHSPQTSVLVSDLLLCTRVTLCLPLQEQQLVGSWETVPPLHDCMMPFSHLSATSDCPHLEYIRQCSSCSLSQLHSYHVLQSS